MSGPARWPSLEKQRQDHSPLIANDNARRCTERDRSPVGRTRMGTTAKSADQCANDQIYPGPETDGRTESHIVKEIAQLSRLEDQRETPRWKTGPI